MTALPHLALGLSLGAASSLLPGPCGLAVMSAAQRHGLARALATAFGAGVGDAIYAALGILGLGPVLVRHRAVPPVLQSLGGVVLIGFGLLHLRARRPARARSTAPAVGGRLARGAAVGLVTLLANPGALLAWVVGVGSLLAGAAPADAWCAVAGIGTGSAAWFALVAVVTWRGHAGHARVVAHLTTLVSGALIAVGVVTLVRGARGWLG